MIDKILQGDCIEGMATLPDDCIDCCITSPPYWGLRDYGVDGQLGLEKTPEQYLAKLVKVFAEVKRLLKPTGTLWLNLGDSYVSGKGRYSSCPQTISGRERNEPMNGNRPDLIGHAYLKDKDLCGIPWRVAFALQAEGWYLRQDIIWHKPNPMPESVTDRCTKSHEYIFLLSKQPTYYFDMESIKENSKEESMRREMGARNDGQKWIDGVDGQRPHSMHKPRKSVGGCFGKQNYDVADTKCQSRVYDRPLYEKRHPRSVWTIASVTSGTAHFATFPLELAERALLAGCPEGGIVFDPFMGSGTVALAAVKHYRKYLGCELNEKYLAIANARIEKATQQMKLFEGMKP
jgi:DNA modification methylase